MDPGAKRKLWNIINKTRNSGRSVVMTSHSMEGKLQKDLFEREADDNVCFHGV